MPRAETTKLYRTFVKGLITEASPLTFPEDASIDEDNLILYRKGNRSRRLGMNFESGFGLLSLDGESEAAPGDVLPEDVDSGTPGEGDPLDDDDTGFPTDPDDPPVLEPW